MTLPFVSCICVTRNRRFFLRRAVEYFRRARAVYPGKTELVIVDGSAEPNRDYNGAAFYVHLPDGCSTMRIVAGSPELAIGHHHNVACDKAQGDVIIKWDDDDWQSPNRIVRQAELLAEADDAIGYSSAFWWYHMIDRKACKAYSWAQQWGTTGGILAFHKSAWRHIPFPDRGVEDEPFCRMHKEAGTLMLDARDPTLFMYMRHTQNGSPLINYTFTDEDTAGARALLSEYDDLNFYDELSELLPFQLWNHPNAPGSKMHAINPLQQLYLRHFR